MTTPSSAPTRLFELRSRWQDVSREAAAGPRILLLASYTIDPVIPYAGLGLHEAGLSSSLSVGTSNQIVQHLLDDDGEIARLRPDVVVVAARFEELADAQDARRAYAAVWQQELLRLADVAVAAAERWEACLVFVLPAVPEGRPHGVADGASFDGVVSVAMRAREALRRRLAGLAGVCIADTEEAVRSVGARHAHHSRLFRFAKVPYTEEVFAALGDQLSRVVRSHFGRDRRLAILDLDSLLLPAAGGRPDGEAANAVSSAALELRDAGVAVAARGCASDGAARALAATSPHLLGNLLSACALDEHPVEEQLGRLARDAGMPIGQTAVVTADPALAAQIDASSPAGVVLLADDPGAWLGDLCASGLLDRAPDVLVDAADPAADDPAGAPAARANSSLSMAAFIASLDVTLAFEPVQEPDVPAIYELVERAKDFTLGIPQSAAQLAARREELVGVAVRDRFGDHGVGAVFAMAAAGATCTVDLLSVSCAVLGREVEDAILREIAERATAAGCDTLVLRHRATPHNEPALRFVRAAAAQDASAGAGAIRVLAHELQTATER